MQSKGYTDIMVATVEVFQGKEKPIILASTVRCQVGGIGFLKNPKVFMNVFILNIYFYLNSILFSV